MNLMTSFYLAILSHPTGAPETFMMYLEVFMITISWMGRLNTPKAEVGIGLMMPAHHSSRCDFHFWILLLLFIASPQGTVLKIQVKSCWKSLADRLLQEFIMFSFVDIYNEIVF